MSEQEAIDAYGKLPLSCFFFSQKAHALLRRGQKVWPCTGPQLPKIRPRRNTHSQKAAFGEGQLPWGDDPAEWQQGLANHAELLYGGLWPGIDMTVRGEGATSSTSSA